MLDREIMDAWRELMAKEKRKYIVEACTVENCQAHVVGDIYDRAIYIRCDWMGECEYCNDYYCGDHNDMLIYDHAGGYGFHRCIKCTNLREFKN